jgi:hypothetical protein
MIRHLIPCFFSPLFFFFFSGTNQAQALKLIEASKLRIIPADDLNDAAQKAVHIANIAQIANKINISVNFEAPN